MGNFTRLYNDRANMAAIAKSMEIIKSELNKIDPRLDILEKD